MDEPYHDAIRQAAGAIAGADALLFTAGAGMGVDSGLPDFRGPEGFWRAYPPYARLGLKFTDLANPDWFASDPPLAWGFYGHRLELYRRTRPHPGFAILQRWAGRLSAGHFVVTSNVDGHFQRAGFDPDRVVEVHGAIDWMQCTASCGEGNFPADPYAVHVDESTMLAAEPLPSCPRCGALARPNILMFGDFGWDGGRTEAQQRRLNAWLRTIDGSRLVIVECGAGKAVPTIRLFSEQMVRRPHRTLVRINVREPDVPAGHVALPMPALAALNAIDVVLSGTSSG